MKRLISSLLALCMVFSLIACGSNDGTTGSGGDGGAAGSSGGSTQEEKSVTLTFSHTRPEGSVTDVNVRAFADAVEEKTNGTVKFEIHAADSLGDNITVGERMAMGDVDAQLAGLCSSLEPQKNMFPYAPYLVTDYDQAYDMFAHGQMFFNELAEANHGVGIELICGYPAYFGAIGLVKENPNPADLSQKSNIMVRIPNAKSFQLVAEAYGYMTTPLVGSDTFTALQTGMVEGVFGMGNEGLYSNYRDLLKYYIDYKDHLDIWFLQFSTKTWEKLSDNQRQAIQEAAYSMEQARFETVENDDTYYEEQLQAAGIEVIKFTGEELENFSSVAYKTVWPEIMGEYDEDLLNRVFKEYNITIG